jgi:hypothetical protein
LTAIASLVRCEIKRRSNCPDVASTCAIDSPAGVEVSTAQREVEHRPRQPVELGHDERFGFTRLERP